MICPIPKLTFRVLVAPLGALELSKVILQVIKQCGGIAKVVEFWVTQVKVTSQKC